MNSERTTRGSLGLWLALATSLGGAACTRGGGAGGSATFFLQDAAFGREVREDSGPRVVSPLTYVNEDPITGLVEPGSLQALAAGVDVEKLLSLGLGPGFSPLVVPRNATLVLRFSAAVDPTSVRLDELGDDGQVLVSGTVVVRRADGRGIPLRSQVHGNELWLDGRGDGHVGFPASPLAFDATGAPRADTRGFLGLWFPQTDGEGLRSLSGALLGARADGQGSETRPLAFNPGNDVLDFIRFHEILPGDARFRGFLPDRTAPRIVREYVVRGLIEAARGDHGDLLGLVDVGAGFNTAASGGRGEWAGQRLILRPGTPAEERQLVDFHTTERLTLRASLSRPPADGDAYELRRTEYFEPDANEPIDPSRFDPYNPQNAVNRELARFIEAYEIDAQGQVVDGPIDLRGEAVPPFSELRVRFSEAMSLSSLAPWETFQVQRVPALPGDEVLARVILSADQTVATLRPAFVNSVTGVEQVVGWGPGTQPFELILQTVPDAGFLATRIGDEEAVKSFLARGERSITDAGGQPLAYLPLQVDLQDPVVRHRLTFISMESAASQPPPLVEDWGVIVHRFQGRPLVKLDPATGEPGVGFGDQSGLYHPVADINLLVNGLLAAPPVTFVRKVFDDYFPPADGQMNPFPAGLGVPLRSFRGEWKGVGFTYDGVRLQHVYRDVDASPGADLAGTLMDLYQVSWAPIGGSVSTDLYDDVSIRAAHSTFRPITQIGFGGGIRYIGSGIGRPFEFDSWLASFGLGSGLPCDLAAFNEGPNHYDELVTVVPAGTPYLVRQSSAFSIPGSGNTWLPWPTFEKRFQYNNGGTSPESIQFRVEVNQAIVAANNGVNSPPWIDRRRVDMGNEGGDSLLLEFRIQPQSQLITGQNGFTFSIATLTTRFPFVRVFSSGGDLDNDGRVDPTERLFPDQTVNDVRARCAAGPNPLSASITTPGDNSRYFATFDYVKTTAVIQSPYVQSFRPTRPVYHPALLDPPPAEQPPGASIAISYSGAQSAQGGQASRFTPDITDLQSPDFLAFRLRLEGGAQEQLSPSLDCVAIPFRRR